MARTIVLQQADGRKTEAIQLVLKAGWRHHDGAGNGVWFDGAD